MTDGKNQFVPSLTHYSSFLARSWKHGASHFWLYCGSLNLPGHFLLEQVFVPDYSPTSQDSLAYIGFLTACLPMFSFLISVVCRNVEVRGYIKLPFIVQLALSLRIRICWACAGINKCFFLLIALVPCLFIQESHNNIACIFPNTLCLHSALTGFEGYLRVKTPNSMKLNLKV